MKNYKIGIIGVGGRGRHAYMAHQLDKGFEIVRGADPSDKALAEFKERFPNAATSHDYNDIINDPEISVVFVMAPDFLHEEMATKALLANKHVYCEKPMAITVEGCDRILQAAYQTKAKIFIGHNMRYFDSVLKMKEVIDSGIIGDIQCGWCRHFISYGGDAYFKDWHSEQKNACGLLLQKAAHDIDVMHWLMGSYTKRVVGMGMLTVYDKCERRDPSTPGIASWSDDNFPADKIGPVFSPVIDVEDHNMILMQLENGSQANYVQCHYTPDAERNYTFIGTKGRVENIGDYGNCEVHVWTQRGKRSQPDIVYHLKEKAGSHGGSDPMIIDNFLDFIANGADTNATPIAARNSVATGVMGHYSMRNGNMPQDIPALDPKLVKYFEDGQK